METDHSVTKAKADETAKPEGFAKELARDVSKGLLKETGVTLKWGLWGAVLGAIVLGGVGAWYFSAAGLVVGALAGALLGGIAGVVVYIQGSSLL
jgi:hypothetical protein